MYVIGDADGYASIAALSGPPLAEQVPVDLDDVVVLPYSSGTTGLAKGVMLTHRNLVSNIEQALAAVKVVEDDAFVAVLPFFHIYGMQVLMNFGLRAGATIVTMPRFDLEQFLSLHQEHQLTRAFVAPPMVVALAKHPVVDNYDLSALRWILSGAAPLSADLAIECGQRLGCEVVQGYGMTELSPVSHATPSGMFKPGSVGVTVPNTEVNIVDPATESPLGVDQDGEVWVRGPQVMKGYLNNEAATKSTIDADGWLHTGDIGHIDADGHLFIVDRLKELIKYKGFQVPPAELEALLLTHPQIADAAVIGLPDDEAGEIPAAYVVLKQGSDDHRRRHPSASSPSGSPATSRSARSPSSTRYRSPPRARSCGASCATEPSNRAHPSADPVSSGNRPESAPGGRRRRRPWRGRPPARPRRWRCPSGRARPRWPAA